MINVESAAADMASWLHRIRIEGRPCPTNLIQSIMMILGCTSYTAQAVRKHLVHSGRLVVNPIRSIYQIDGQRFDTKTRDADEVAVIKNALRRRFKPVYDPRTVAHPERVAVGIPDTLMCGSRIIPFEKARQIAASIGAS